MSSTVLEASLIRIVLRRILWVKHSLWQRFCLCNKESNLFFYPISQEIATNIYENYCTNISIRPTKVIIEEPKKLGSRKGCPIFFITSPSKRINNQDFAFKILLLEQKQLIFAYILFLDYKRFHWRGRFLRSFPYSSP